MPGEARATIEWHNSGARLVQRPTVETPRAPNGVSIMGCDAANGTYYQLYSGDRGVCRVYQMSTGDGESRLWREGEPFPQRFTGRFEDDGNTIVGRWEKAEDGSAEPPQAAAHPPTAHGETITQAARNSWPRPSKPQLTFR